MVKYFAKMETTTKLNFTMINLFLNLLSFCSLLELGKLLLFLKTICFITSNATLIFYFF